MAGFQSGTVSIPETAADVKIIGSMKIPAVSYGGDLLSYTGPIEQFFFGVEGWDDEHHKVIGQIPKLYPHYSAVYVQVENDRKVIIKAFVAKITGVRSYSLGTGDMMQIKFNYEEVPISAVTDDVTVIPPTIAHIITDPEPDSDLIALVLEGSTEACAIYAQTKLDIFRHGGKTYHLVSMFQQSVCYSETLSGTKLYHPVGGVVIAHPSIPAPDIGAFHQTVTSILNNLYGGMYNGNG